MSLTRTALAALLLFPAPLSAQKKKLTLKDLQLTPRQLEEAAGPRPVELHGFTLNAEVLGRYGYTLEAYQSMSNPEQEKISQWIQAMEAQRLAAPERQARHQRPKWDSEQLQALSRIKAETLFDQGKAGSGAPSVSAWDATLSMQEDQFRRFSLRNKPHDFELEFGDLGAGGASPLWGRSPYLNLKKDSEGSGSVFDYGYAGQAALVHSQARLYHDDKPGLDARIDSLAANVPDQSLRPAHVATEFQDSNLFVGSLMGHVGRAWRAAGPFDFGFSAAGLAKVTGIFPNVTLDQSAAVRANISPDQHVGVFGGLTEAVGLFAKTVVQDSLPSGKVALDPKLDLAPHASVAAWGKLPYLSSVEYSAEAGRQWNPWTTVQSFSGSLSGPVGKGRAGVRGSYSTESGDIEYGRDKASLGVAYSPAPGVDISADYARDHARLGSAAMDRDSVMLGLRLSGKDWSEPSVSFEELLGGKDRFIIPDAQAPLFIRALSLELGVLQGLKDSADKQIPGGTDALWRQAQQAYDSLPMNERQNLNDAWRTNLPAAPPLEEVLAINASEDLDKAIALAELISGPEVLDRILVRAMRAQVLENLAKVEVPLLGQKIKMTAPMVLAAAHSFAVGVRPLPGVTAADARAGLDPQAFRQLSDQLGCSGSGAQAMADCLLDKLPAAERDHLKKAYGKDLAELLKQAVSWSSDVIRREMNSLILQVMIAAERLNELNVDRGERIGDINVRVLKNQFIALDGRGKKSRSLILNSAANRVGAELKAQDSAMRQTLTEYGQKRLAWLESQPSWPENIQVAVRPEQWPALLAVYGDQGLFRLILQAKAKLAAKNDGAPARLLIELNDNRMLDSLGVAPGDPTVVTLPRNPPKTRELDLKL